MMESIAKMVRNLERTAKTNSPAIFASMAVASSISTMLLTARATFKAAEDIRAVEAQTGTNGELKGMLKERAAYTWQYYIPPAIACTTTVVCIFGCLKTGNRKTAVAMTAYSVSERAFNEYRDKVVEQVGIKKEEEIRDSVAQDFVKNNTPKAGDVIIAGGGKVLCCELYTRRYFTCDMQTLRRAENDINHVLNHEMYATLSDFYNLIGVPVTSDSDNVGWDMDKQLELQFSSVLTDDDQPCLAFGYNYTKVLT